MKGLKQSTVATVIIGPVLDANGAAVTTAVVGDFRIAKNGTVATLSGATVTHDANGFYTIALTTGNTDTTGRLVITSGNTSHSMASHHWSVLPASVFDAIYTNATNTSGGLATATGAITALAGAISTYAGGNVAGITGVTFPSSVANDSTVAKDATVAKETTLTNRPTLTQIEASTVLAKENTVSSRASQTSVDTKPTLTQIEASTILAKEATAASILTAIQNLNNLSAKINVFGSPLLEIPETGSTVYAFTVIVKDDEDKLVALDASPTITAANAAGTNRSANLSAVSNPSTGRYTFTYTVASTHPSESLRINVSGTVSGEARYIEWIGAVVNYDTLSVLQQIQTDLSGKPTLAQIEGSTVLAKETTLTNRPTLAQIEASSVLAKEGTVSQRPTLTQIEASTVLAKEATVVARATQTSVDALPTATQNRDAVWNAMPGAGWTNGSFGDRGIISNNSNRTIGVTGSGSGHVQVDVHAMQPDVLTASAVAADAVAEIQNGLATATAVATVNSTVNTISSNVSTLLTRIPAALFAGITSLANWLGALAGKSADATTRGQINATPAGATYNETTDSLEAVRDRGDAAWITGTSQGTGARIVTITVRDSSANAVESATVRIYRAGETYAGVTNASGVATFSVDDATFTVAITAAGFSFTPVSLVVGGNVSQTYTLTSTGGITPSAAPATTGFWTVYSVNGVPQAGAQVTIQASSPPVGSTGVVMEDAPRTATADSQGVVQFANLLKGATYIVYRTGSSRKYSILVPSTAGDSVALGSIVG